MDESPAAKMPKGLKHRGKVISVPFVKGFKRPTLQAQRDALGPTDDNGFHIGVETGKFFPSLPSPTSEDDWLAKYKEKGQTLADFLEFCPWLGHRKISRFKGMELNDF